MQKLVMILTLVNQLFPLLIQTVKMVEQAFPQGGQGAAKLEMVRKALEDAFQTVTDVQVSFDQMWPTLKGMIDMAVKIYNLTGEFKKAS